MAPLLCLDSTLEVLRFLSRSQLAQIGCVCRVFWWLISEKVIAKHFIPEICFGEEALLAENDQKNKSDDDASTSTPTPISGFGRQYRAFVNFGGEFDYYEYVEISAIPQVEPLPFITGIGRIQVYNGLDTSVLNFFKAIRHLLQKCELNLEQFSPFVDANPLPVINTFLGTFADCTIKSISLTTFFTIDSTDQDVDNIRIEDVEFDKKQAAVLAHPTIHCCPRLSIHDGAAGLMSMEMLMPWLHHPTAKKKTAAANIAERDLMVFALRIRSKTLADFIGMLKKHFLEEIDPDKGEINYKICFYSLPPKITDDVTLMEPIKLTNAANGFFECKPSKSARKLQIFRHKNEHRPKEDTAKNAQGTSNNIGNEDEQNALLDTSLMICGVPHDFIPSYIY